jgi:hypothetical protein
LRYQNATLIIKYFSPQILSAIFFQGHLDPWKFRQKFNFGGTDTAPREVSNKKTRNFQLSITI